MAFDSMISDSITVFSESNVSESESSFLGMFNMDSAHPHTSSGSSATPIRTSADDMEKSASKSKFKSFVLNVLLVQKLSLPEEIQHCRVKLLEPTQDKTKVVVVVGDGKEGEQLRGAILVYNVTVSSSNIICLDPEPLAKKLIEELGEVPIGSCFLTNDAGKLSTAFVLANGSVKIYSLPDFTLEFIIHPSGEDTKITSVAYSSSES